MPTHAKQLAAGIIYRILLYLSLLTLVWLKAHTHTCAEMIQKSLSTIALLIKYTDELDMTDSDPTRCFTFRHSSKLLSSGLLS